VTRAGTVAKHERPSVGPWFEPRSGSQSIQGVAPGGATPSAGSEASGFALREDTVYRRAQPIADARERRLLAVVRPLRAGAADAAARSCAVARLDEHSVSNEQVHEATALIGADPNHRLGH